MVNIAGAPVNKITLDRTSAVLTPGESFTVTVVLSPYYRSENYIVWSSSDTQVATVENGLVKAVTKGTATLIAAAFDGRIIDTCHITVVPGNNGNSDNSGNGNNGRITN